MKVLLINTSREHYNLGIAKAKNYWLRQGAEVVESTSVHDLFIAGEGFDLVWISAIFSWHVPDLIAAAQICIQAGIKTEVGGPGTFGLHKEIYEATGLHPRSTPDVRFEREPGEYKAVFWSRGCPAKNCSLGFPRDGMLPICSVPEMEGWRFTLYDGFVTPAPVILDNNLSALPKAHQELIIERTLSAGFKKVDANSGFEPRSFHPDTCERWKQLPLIAWRFAYDELAERPAVLKMIQILDDYGIYRTRLRIYCLAGNEPLETCEQRVREIREWGAMAIVQRRRPLDWLGEPHPLPCLYDWTPQKLIDFQRWGNRLSKKIAFKDYRRSAKDCRDSETESFLTV
jgi:hypothetical protein